MKAAKKKEFDKFIAKLWKRNTSSALLDRLPRMMSEQQFTNSCDELMRGVSFRKLPAQLEEEAVSMVLGQKFAFKLREEIGAKNFRAMQKRNANEPSAGICHSHDFCDANMVMLEAMQEILPEIAKLEPNDERFCEPFNAAWDWARSIHLGGRPAA